jgi:hypothetical protein
LAAYLTDVLEMNVSPMQTWRIVHGLDIVSKKPKLSLLERESDYEEKKETIDNYKKISAALLKKGNGRI